MFIIRNMRIDDLCAGNVFHKCVQILNA